MGRARPPRGPRGLSASALFEQRPSHHQKVLAAEHSWVGASRAGVTENISLASAVF
jgi:hypothetical protein